MASDVQPAAGQDQASGFTWQRPPSNGGDLPPSAAIGAAYNPFDPGFLSDPHAFFARARSEAPVCYNPLFNMWLVTGYDEVLQVCEDSVLYSSKNKVDPPNDVKPEVLEILATEGHSVVLQLFNSDPPQHDRIRALIGKGFTNESFRAAIPGTRKLAHELIDGFIGRGRVDLRAGLADPLPLSIILDYIGVPREDHPRVKVWDDWWARLFTSAHAIEEQMDAVRQVVAYQKYFEALIEDRRVNPRDDLASRLTAARMDGYEPLRTVELIWQFMGLLAAGHATTTDATTNLLLVILEKPGLWSSLKEHPEQVSNFIEEGLRFVNPVLGLPRITTAEVELAGVTIPAGSQVLVSFCSANRDAKLTPEPDCFEPGRQGVSRHLAFGRGIHYCVGARIARNMMAVMIEALLERLPGLRLPPDHRTKHTVHPFLWGLSELPVEWDV